MGKLLNVVRFGFGFQLIPDQRVDTHSTDSFPMDQLKYPAVARFNIFHEAGSCTLPASIAIGFTQTIDSQ